MALKAAKSFKAFQPKTKCYFMAVSGNFFVAALSKSNFPEMFPKSASKFLSDFG